MIYNIIDCYLLRNNELYQYNKEWKLLYQIKKIKNKYYIYQNNILITFIIIKKTLFKNYYIYHQKNYSKITKKFIYFKYLNNHFPKLKYNHLCQYPKLFWIKQINNYNILKPKISGHHNLYRFTNGILFYITDINQLYLYIGLAILEYNII